MAAPTEPALGRHDPDAEVLEMRQRAMTAEELREAPHAAMLRILRVPS